MSNTQWYWRHTRISNISLSYFCYNLKQSEKKRKTHNQSPNKTCLFVSNTLEIFGYSKSSVPHLLFLLINENFMWLRSVSWRILMLTCCVIIRYLVWLLKYMWNKDSSISLQDFSFLWGFIVCFFAIFLSTTSFFQLLTFLLTTPFCPRQRVFTLCLASFFCFSFAQYNLQLFLIERKSHLCLICAWFDFFCCISSYNQLV